MKPDALLFVAGVLIGALGATAVILMAYAAAREEERKPYR